METTQNENGNIRKEMFRRLHASEIEIRVGPVSKNGRRASLLCYKNARVDMQILDETVGPMNWAREHREVKGVVYCGVGIRDERTGQFIWKWDCGKESNTEPQKGEASDSFKRACVNWGIGRELYAHPDIWVDLSDKEWNNGQPRLDFTVRELAYDEAGNVTKLIIVDRAQNVRWAMGGGNNANAQKIIRPGMEVYTNLLGAIKRQNMQTRQQITDAITRQGYTISDQDFLRLCVDADVAA